MNGRLSRFAKTSVKITLRPIATTVPRTMPLKRCSFGRPAQASAITTALSPDKKHVDPNDFEDRDEEIRKGEIMPPPGESASAKTSFAESARGNGSAGEGSRLRHQVAFMRHLSMGRVGIANFIVPHRDAAMTAPCAT